MHLTSTTDAAPCVSRCSQPSSPFLLFLFSRNNFNFESMAYDDNAAILGMSIAFPIIAIASVIFRFEARRIKRLRPEADDWTILAALVNLCPNFIELILHFSLTQSRCSTSLSQSLSSSVSLYTAVARASEADRFYAARLKARQCRKPCSLHASECPGG